MKQNQLSDEVSLGISVVAFFTCLFFVDATGLTTAIVDWRCGPEPTETLGVEGARRLVTYVRCSSHAESQVRTCAAVLVGLLVLIISRRVGNGPKATAR